MAELYTHVLVAFTLAVAISWQLEWITRPYVAAVVVGAVIPDLNRIELIVPAAIIESVTGLTWAWTVFHRAGGVILVVLLFTLLVPPRHRRVVFAMLVLGVASHFVLDYLLWQPSGQTNLMLWPVTDIHLGYQGFYRSSDSWPALLATVTAAVVVAIDRYYFNNQTDSPDQPN